MEKRTSAISHDLWVELEACEYIGVNENEIQTLRNRVIELEESHAQEVKEIAIAFAKKINGHSLTFTNLEKEYNKFIDNYYK